MKKIILLVLIVLAACSPRYYEKIYKKTYVVADVVEINEKIKKAENPAQKKLFDDRLKEGLISIESILVKDVVESQIVDYNFCVVGEYNTEFGVVECYIYSKNLKKIAALENGKTKIEVLGKFNRMYKLLDDVYLKIDIVESAIKILE